MKIRWILPLLALLVHAPLFAGVVYEIEVKDHEQSPPKTESIQAAVEGRHLKMGIAAGGRGQQGEMIFNGERREMVVVDHENKTYHVIDQAAIEEIAGQLSQASSAIEEALKNVPEAQRKMVEEMMKKNMPPSVTPPRSKSELRKTGERATQNGYPCVKYEVLRDGRKIRELWVTDWGNIDGGSDVTAAFEDLSGFVQQLLDAIPNLGGGRGPSLGDNPYEHLKELGGFPVVTRELGDDGSLENESTLRSASRRTLDPAEFEPPAGYKRQSMGLR